MMNGQREWPAWVLVAIVATVVAVNAFDYSVLVPQQRVRYEMQHAIVSGTAPAAQKLHLLVPFVMEPIIGGFATAMPRDVAFRRAYFAFHAVALIALLASVYAYARLWFTRDQALIGALIVGASLRLVLRQGEYWDFSPIPVSSVFAPWSLLEPTFVALTLLFLYRRQWGWLSLTIVLAALNSGLAILVSAFTASPGSTWQQNVNHLPTLAVNLTLFLGAATVLAVLGYRRSPPFARRAAAGAAGFAGAILALGYWWEVRAITLLYPVVTPLILSSLFAPTSQPHGRREQ
jgi:hypothetical protein